MTTNHGSPVPPASAPAATAEPNYTHCGRCGERYDIPAESFTPARHTCTDGVTLPIHAPGPRPAAPSGEEAETITPGERHQAMISAGIDATSPNQRTRELSALVVKYEALVTAQATELAALRARVEELTAVAGRARNVIAGVADGLLASRMHNTIAYQTLRDAQKQLDAALAPQETP